MLGQKLLDLYLTIEDIELIATARGENRYPRKEGYTYTSLDITNEKEVQHVIAQHAPRLYYKYCCYDQRR